MSPNFLPWRKSPKSRTETEERRRKRWKETPQTSRSKKVLTSRQKQDVNKLERRIFCFRRSQYSIFLPLVRWCRGPNWFNSLRNRNKLKGKFVSFYRQIIQQFFATLIRNTDCKYFFNSGTLILTKLDSISLTEIVLKLQLRTTLSSWKLHWEVHSHFAAKDFTPHKPHFRVTFFARPRITGNTKPDYSRDFVDKHD